MDTVNEAILSVPTREEVSAKNQAIFDNLKKALGFVPNLYATMAHSDNALERYLNYQNGATSFSNKEKEVINLAVSQINECVYCQSAHTVIGKMNGFSEEQTLDIRRGKISDEKLDALLQLTIDITQNKGNVQGEKLDAFFDQGYTKEHLVDLIIQISEKVAMNYLHNLSKVFVDFPLAPEL